MKRSVATDARRYRYLREHGLYSVYLACCGDYDQVNDDGDTLDKEIDKRLLKPKKRKFMNNSTFQEK